MKTFKVGTMRDGNDDPQSREEMVDWTGGKNMQGDVHKRDFLINKTGPKEAQLKHMYADNKMP